MHVVDLPDWAGFEAELRCLFTKRDRIRVDTEMHVSSLLFRGQSNSSWQLETTLERFAPQSLKARDYYNVMHAAKDQVESLTGQSWNIPTPPDYEQWLKAQD